MAITDKIVTFTASILENGRGHVDVAYVSSWSGKVVTSSYTTVKNIDGSNRLMCDSGLWQFIPEDWALAAGGALALAKGEAVRFPWCIPANHVMAVGENRVLA